MADEADDRSRDTVKESGAPKSSESAVQEAGAGKTDLVQKQKEATDYLKKGGTSGITDQFGKPLWLISESSTASGDARSMLGAPAKVGDAIEAGKSADTYHPDSSSSTTRSDSPVINRDAQGNVTHITQPEGLAVDIKYDAQGQPTEIKGKGATWTKDATGGWTETDSAGHTLATAKYIDVDKTSGDITIANNNKYIQTFHADGSTEVTRPDNAIIDRDAHGNVTDIVQPGGKDEFHIKNDAQGHPVEIKDKNTTWTKDSTGAWTQTDNEGHTLATAKHIDVDKDSGDITIANNNKHIQTFRADGSTETTRPDNAIINRDADGNVTEIVQPGGQNGVHIKNDADGHPVEIKGKGTTWTKDATGSWAQTDNAGHTLATAKYIEVDKASGDITIANNNKNIQTFHADGSTEVTRSDNAFIDRDAKGNITEIVQPGGQNSVHIKSDADGHPIEIKGKSTIWTKDATGGWTQADNEGHTVATAKRIDVDNNSGDITIVNNDKSLHKYRPDGSSSTTRPDDAVIDRDAQGKITAITQPGGKTAVDIKNDADGNPIEIKGKSTTWTKDATGDWTQSDSQGHTLRTAKHIEVDKNTGDITIENSDKSVNRYRPDGSSSTTRPDNAVIDRDAHGKITAITQPGGKTTVDIKNDADGNPIEIKGKSTTWTKDATGDWTQSDSQGHTLRTAKHIDVDKNTGDITIVNNDKSLNRYRPDGSSSTTRPDDAVIDRDAQGNITAITQPGGQSAVDIKNDADGNPTEIKGKSTTWTKDATGAWTHTDSAGHTLGTAKHIDVDKNTGDIVITNSDKSVQTFHANGSSGTAGADGSIVVRDAQNRVTEVTYPDRSMSHVIRDQAGNPIEINSTDGTTWKKEGNGWNKYDEAGHKLDQAEDITVASNGDVDLAKHGSTVTVHPDKSVIDVDKNDKSEVTQNISGNVSDVKYPNGSSVHIEYDDQKPPSPKEVKGAGFDYKRDGDHWNVCDDTGNPIPGMRVDDIAISPGGEINYVTKGVRTTIQDRHGSSMTVDAPQIVAR